MLSKVRKWGNSQGIRLSKELLSDAEMHVGDTVKVAVRKGRLIVTPVHRVRGRYDLRELVRRISGDETSCELDWGTPAGREVW